MIFKFFYEDEPREAFKLLCSMGKVSILTRCLETDMKEGKLKFKDETNKEEAFKEFLLQEEVLMLREDFKIIEEMLAKEMQGNLDGWQMYKDKPKSKIYYKIEDGHPIVTVYAEQVVEAPLINIAALIAEV